MVGEWVGRGGGGGGNQKWQPGLDTCNLPRLGARVALQGWYCVLAFYLLLLVCLPIIWCTDASFFPIHWPIVHGD